MGATAKVTLIKCKSSTKLGTRFEQNKTMYISDEKLIASCTCDGDFVVNMMTKEAPAKAEKPKQAAPFKSSPSSSKEQEAAKILGDL